MMAGRAAICLKVTSYSLGFGTARVCLYVRESGSGKGSSTHASFLNVRTREILIHEGSVFTTLSGSCQILVDRFGNSVNYSSRE